MPRSAYLILIFLVGIAVYWVILPQEPAPFTNKPIQTIKVKFHQERATRLILGSDTEMRMAVPVEGPSLLAIPVACLREFNPDPTKAYTVDGYGMTDETGRSIRSPVWILRSKIKGTVSTIEHIPNVGQFTAKK